VDDTGRSANSACNALDFSHVRSEDLGASQGFHAFGVGQPLAVAGCETGLSTAEIPGRRVECAERGG